jgi:hypothetical protein
MKAPDGPRPRARIASDAKEVSVKLRLFLLGVALLVATPAWAEETGDLEQTITDLGSQATDKERIDKRGASKVELSQIRGWLTDATNAVKESGTKVVRRFLDLVRAQMKLVDELIGLSQVEQELARLQRDIGKTKQSIATLGGRLEEKRAHLRALKMREGEK